MNKNFLAVISVTLLLAPTPADAIIGFDESFNGDGAFETVDGAFTGLDNPGWEIFGDGELRDGGYVAFNDPHHPNVEHSDTVHRELFGGGSFRHHIEIRDLEFAKHEDPHFGTTRSVFLEHKLDNFGATFIFVVLGPAGDLDKWSLSAWAGRRDSIGGFVNKGSHIGLTLAFDEEASTYEVGYDDNLLDDIEPVVFSDSYGLTAGLQQFVRVKFQAVGDGIISGTLDQWSLTDLLASDGDFNEDGILNVADIELLAAEIRRGTNDLGFDLNQDASVDEFDRNIWVHDLKNTYYGDGDLDGEFNTRDLVEVFQAGQYEDDIEFNSTWATGDWNGDGDFNSRDLVFAFQDGGFEKGPRAAAQAVPELEGVLTLVGMLSLLALRRRVG